MGMGLLRNADAGDFPGWVRFVGAAVVAMAALVLASPGWRRRNPELAIVPGALAMVASGAVHTAFDPGDDWLAPVSTAIIAVSVVATVVIWWLSRRHARHAG
jgi:hypothetical protein